ncbi:MAG: hypothetical protein RPU13_13755 [Candidatus Sedimenticola sp. (ex Thyasira tokunagai)]
MNSIHHHLDNTFEEAFIGIPQGVGGLEHPFHGNLKTFLRCHPKFMPHSRTPTVLYMHGSSGLSNGAVFREYIVEGAGLLFFAPNSHRAEHRPRYCSPAPIEQYQAIHDFRIAELQHNLERMEELPFIDFDNLFLMGNSEGAVAAATFPSTRFRGRIITAFSCEECYFCRHFRLGSRPDEPFLNIIGRDDDYFAKDSPMNENLKVVGHGTETLKENPNAKVVILPKTRHDITTNPYAEVEIINFLKHWGGR